MSRLPEFMSQVHVKRFWFFCYINNTKAILIPRVDINFIASGSVKDINSSKQTCFENFDDS